MLTVREMWCVSCCLGNQVDCEQSMEIRIQRGRRSSLSEARLDKDKRVCFLRMCSVWGISMKQDNWIWGLELRNRDGPEIQIWELSIPYQDWMQLHRENLWREVTKTGARGPETFKAQIEDRKAVKMMETEQSQTSSRKARRIIWFLLCGNSGSCIKSYNYFIHFIRNILCFGIQMMFIFIVSVLR